jgi:ADP-ribose pyrophosphatase YjhB (NUDIX family)
MDVVFQPVTILHGWKHCPRCGAPLELHPDRAECAACGSTFWAHSQPTASAFVTDAAGRLLLGRRAGDPWRGYWDTPGGFVEEGEDPLDALRRELREETGLDVEPGGFVGAFVDRYGDGPDAPFTLNLYWAASVLGGRARAADDVAELRWFELDELPSAEEIAFENVAKALARWRDEHA